MLMVVKVELKRDFWEPNNTVPFFGTYWPPLYIFMLCRKKGHTGLEWYKGKEFTEFSFLGETVALSKIQVSAIENPMLMCYF